MPQEDQGRRRAGKRPGPLDGDTPQAEDLAVWLRELTRGLTVRELEERFSYGRTQWSAFLKGRKLIPSWLLLNLVNALVKEPIARQRKLERGRELLEAAEKAAITRQVPAVVEQPAGTVLDLQLRLDDARKGQLQAQEALMGLTRLIYVFMSMVADLQKRCSDLESERDHAGAELRAPDVADIQRQLVDHQKRLAETEARLARARREREEAEELRVEALRLAEERRQTLERLRQQHDLADDNNDDGHGGEDPWAAESRPTELWEYDRVLEAADVQLDAHGAQMAAARERMGIDPAAHDAGVRVVPGEVVRTTSADTTDKHTTSQDTIPGSPADSTDDTEPGPAPGWGFGGTFEPPRAEPQSTFASSSDTFTGTWKEMFGSAAYAPPSSWAYPPPPLKPSAPWWYTTLRLLLSVYCPALVFAVGASAFTYARWQHPGPAVWELVLFGLADLSGTSLLAVIICTATLVVLDRCEDAPMAALWFRSLLSVPTIPAIIGLVHPQWLGFVGGWGAAVAHWLLQ